MENSFFTSSPSPRADLMGGIVPEERLEEGTEDIFKTDNLETQMADNEMQKMQDALTAIVVGGRKLGALVAAAGAVAGLHFELVPGGLTQLAEEELCGGIGLEALPGPGTFGPEVQHHVSDGAAAAGPALQVEACVSGVDVGEQRLVLVEHWLWREERHGATGSQNDNGDANAAIEHVYLDFCDLLTT